MDQVGPPSPKKPQPPPPGVELHPHEVELAARVVFDVRYRGLTLLLEERIRQRLRQSQGGAGQKGTAQQYAREQGLQEWTGAVHGRSRSRPSG